MCRVLLTDLKYAIRTIRSRLIWNDMNHNERPLVTVIIPMYSRAEFLRSIPESLFARTRGAERTEIIIVDGGLADDVRKFCGNTIKILCVRQQEIWRWLAQEAAG